MDGLPNSAAATVILLMLGAVGVVLVSTTTAVLDLVLHRRATRLVHNVALALVVVTYGSLAMLSLRTSVGLLLGWSVGQIKDDFPILYLIPFVPILVLVSFSVPFVRRFRRSRRS